MTLAISIAIGAALTALAYGMAAPAVPGAQARAFAQFEEPPRLDGRLAPPPPRAGSPAARARSLQEGSPGLAEEAIAGDGSPAPPAPLVAATRAAERFETRLALFVRERSLEQVLGDVAQIAGLRIRINDRVDDIRVAEQRLVGNARDVLDRLTTQHNLVWFAERDLVDVSRADTAAVRTFRLDGVSDADIRDAMERFGLVNADFAVEVDERNGVARIFAPPRLAARLESIIVGLRPDDGFAPAGPIEVIRFGLRDRNATE